MKINVICMPRPKRSHSKKIGWVSVQFEWSWRKLGRRGTLGRTRGTPGRRGALGEVVQCNFERVRCTRTVRRTHFSGQKNSRTTSKRPKRANFSWIQVGWAPPSLFIIQVYGVCYGWCVELPNKWSNPIILNSTHISCCLGFQKLFSTKVILFPSFLFSLIPFVPWLHCSLSPKITKPLS